MIAPAPHGQGSPAVPALLGEISRAGGRWLGALGRLAAEETGRLWGRAVVRLSFLLLCLSVLGTSLLLGIGGLCLWLSTRTEVAFYGWLMLAGALLFVSSGVLVIVTVNLLEKAQLWPEETLKLMEETIPWRPTSH